MFTPDPYIIREATDADAPELARVAEVDSQPPLTGRILVGEIDGRIDAAFSLSERRAVADPFRRTAHLLISLRLRADAVLAYDAEPSLSARMRAAVPVRLRARPAVAPLA